MNLPSWLVREYRKSSNNKTDSKSIARNKRKIPIFRHIFDSSNFWSLISLCHINREIELFALWIEHSMKYDSLAFVMHWFYYKDSFYTTHDRKKTVKIEINKKSNNFFYRNWFELVDPIYSKYSVHAIFVINTKFVFLFSLICYVDAGPSFEHVANTPSCLDRALLIFSLGQCTRRWIANLGIRILVSAEIENKIHTCICMKTELIQLKKYNLETHLNTYLNIFTFNVNITATHIVHQFVCIFFRGKCKLLRDWTRFTYFSCCSCCCLFC